VHIINPTIGTKDEAETTEAERSRLSSEHGLGRMTPTSGPATVEDLHPSRHRKELCRRGSTIAIRFRNDRDQLQLPADPDRLILEEEHRQRHRLHRARVNTDNRACRHLEMKGEGFRYLQEVGRWNRGRQSRERLSRDRHCLEVALHPKERRLRLRLAPEKYSGGLRRRLEDPLRQL